jgi:hypothetical protein
MHAAASNFLLLFLRIVIISAKCFAKIYNVRVWIMNMSMLAKTKFHEILPKQTKFRIETEKDIFVLLEPNIRLVSRVNPL